MMNQAMADVIGMYAEWAGAAEFAAKLDLTTFAVAKDEAVQAGYIEQDGDEFYATETGTAAVFAAMDLGQVAR